MTEYEHQLSRYHPHHIGPVPEYTRNLRNLPMSVGPFPSRLDMRSCPVGRQTRAGSAKLTESDGCNIQTRKRIAVACGRCRKRKIRCSGDSGNGQPCQNCKSAGSDLCQFHRVGSDDLHTVIASNAAGGYGSLYSHGQFMSGALYFSCPQYRAGPNSSSITSPRPLYHVGWNSPSTSCPEESSMENYAPSMACMTLQDSSSGLYVNQESSRNWSGATQKQLVNGSNIGYEQEANTIYQNPQSTYTSGSLGRDVSISGDNQPSLNLVTLHNTLPNTTCDRQLPIPNSNRSTATLPSNIDTAYARMNPASQTQVCKVEQESPVKMTPAIPLWLVDGSDRRADERGSLASTTSSEASGILTAPKSNPVSSTSFSTIGYGTSAGDTSPEPSPVNSTSQSVNYPLSSGGLTTASSVSTDSPLNKQDSSANLYSYDSKNTLKSDPALEDARTEHNSSLTTNRKYASLHQPQSLHSEATGPLISRDKPRTHMVLPTRSRKF